MLKNICQNVLLYTSQQKKSEKAKLNTPQLISSIERSNVSIWYDTKQQHPHIFRLDFDVYVNSICK